ncbi:hypothetical protein HGG71_05645 [Rhodobacteraceae bacterium R_SAG2]|nr:hypothetical protein [Rhodobacteraceae bacterium R_SAG2]
MTLIPLEIAPGVFKNGTDMMAKDRWTDANLVRWHEDSLRPIGGWREFKDTGISFIVRGMIGWKDNSSVRYIAAGTKESLHVVETDGTVSDITPALLSAGFETATINTGYGGSTYGTGLYGTPRDDATNYTEATVWSLDTWGEYLVGCSPADGKLYEWQLDTGVEAAVLSGAPTSCTGLVTTEERFLFALGAGGNPRKVQWCDQEDNTTWTAAATNQAGDIELQTSGGIQQGMRTRGQTLILTDVDAHTATFTGGTAVYSFQRVGDACGAVSRLCGASSGGTAYWMGRRGFFSYSGGAVEPVESEVADHVFTNINRDQISQVWAVSNAQFGEIWWFYPSGDSTEVDSYVIYNYRQNHWNIGSMSRTAGFDQGVWRYPMMVDADKLLYEHEYGFNHGDQHAFAETGPIMIGAGDQVAVVTDMYPDEETQGEVTATFQTRFYPNGTEYTYGPYSMANPTSVRFTGRQVRMRIDGNSNVDWRVGIMRLDAKPGGKR